MDFKRYNKIIIVIMVLIFTATISAIIYNINVGDSQQTMTVKLYFIDPVNSTLKEEERSISKGNETKEDMTSNILDALRSGPKNLSYQKSIPDNIEILGVKLEGEIANVNLSQEYNTLKSSDALYCRAALVYTLTNLDFIKNVKISVDGTELLKANGEALGAISKEDIVINDVITPLDMQSEKIKLYFSNKDSTELVIEEREIQIEVNPNTTSDQQNQLKAKYIMEQLIVGPKSTELIATVPSETKIRDIKVKDGVCYVDLSKEFVDKHSGGSAGELMTIDSIVNSITEIQGINKIQFSIEGEKRQEFKGHVDFSKPFSRTVE